MSLFQTVDKVKIPLKIGIEGASGSGKTYSALTLAKGLYGKLDNVAVADTENKSSLLYRKHFGAFKWLSFEKPYHPLRFVTIIEEAVKEGLDCLIIDSVSAEWEGEGGCLDAHQKFGGKFQDWAKVTPLHRKFIEAILYSEVDLIVTMRKKQDYSMITENGRTKIEKHGLKTVQRESFEYELLTNFSLNQDHLAIASKDRTGLFKDPVPFMITENTGKIIKDWNEH